MLSSPTPLWDSPFAVGAYLGLGSFRRSKIVIILECAFRTVDQDHGTLVEIVETVCRVRKLHKPYMQLFRAKSPFYM